MKRRILAVICLLALTAGSYWLGTRRSTAQSLPLSPEGLQRAYTVAQIHHTVSEQYGGFGRSDEDFDWDALCREAFFEAGQAEHEYDFFRTLLRLSAALEDGHAMILPPDGVTAALPLRLKWLEGGCYVTAVGSTFDLPLLSELVYINGEDTADYLEREWLPYTSICTPDAREQHAVDLFTHYGRPGDTLSLTFCTPNGDTTVRELEYGSPSLGMDRHFLDTDDMPNDFTLVRALPTMRLYRDGPAYTIQDGRPASASPAGCHLILVPTDLKADPAEVRADLLELLPTLREGKGVVIDLRKNGGGNSLNGQQVLAPFVEDERVLTGGVIANLFPEQNTELTLAADPSYSGYSPDPIGTAMLKNRWYPPLDLESPEGQQQLDSARRWHWETAVEGIPKAEVPAVVAIDPSVGSAAEDTAYYAQQWGLPLVGSHTAGYTGSIYLLDLPNGYRMTFSGPRSIRTDTGEDFQNTGIEAEIFADYTVESLLAGEDAILSAAIAALDESVPTE